MNQNDHAAMRTFFRLCHSPFATEALADLRELDGYGLVLADDDAVVLLGTVLCETLGEFADEGDREHADALLETLSGEALLHLEFSLRNAPMDDVDSQTAADRVGGAFMRRSDRGTI